MNRLTGILLILAAFATTLAGQESSPVLYDVLYEANDVGDVSLRVADSADRGLLITSECSYAMEEKNISYKATLRLDNDFRPVTYRIDLKDDGRPERISLRFDRNELEISYSPAGGSNKTWTVETPGQSWVLMDTNSLAGFFLFSQLLTPGMEPIRGDAFLVPIRQFAEFELVSSGPAVIVVDEVAVQCDLYTLTIDEQARYQMFVKDGQLAAVKQEGLELSIRKKDL